MPPLITTQRATAADIDRMLGHMQAGVETYVEFAPPGWQPPAVASWREQVLETLEDPGVWALLALSDGVSVGHVSFFPARERAAGEAAGERAAGAAVDHPLSQQLIPGLAHFWQLFVLPEWWGRGVASLLHDHAIDELRNRGYEQARLFTPSLHARARRFYERHGWALSEEQWHDGFRLMMCEYRIGLRKASLSAF